MYVCVRVCVYVPALCARTHDRQRVPETRIHAMHAGKPRYPCAHPTVTRTSVHVCACLLGPALRAPVATLALAASCMRACVQQDATGALGTCIRTRMRARQTHAEERGGKGGPRRRMRAVAYTRCIALFLLLRAQHCLAARMRWISLSRVASAPPRSIRLSLHSLPRFPARALFLRALTLSLGTHNTHQTALSFCLSRALARSHTRALTLSLSLSLSPHTRSHKTLYTHTRAQKHKHTHKHTITHTHTHTHTRVCVHVRSKVILG